MTISVPSTVSLVHVFCFCGWGLTLLHRSSRGPEIAWHTLLITTRWLGMLLTFFTGVLVLHREPELLSLGMPRAQIIGCIAYIGIDHFVFSRAASPQLHRSALIGGLIYMGLCALRL